MSEIETLQAVQSKLELAKRRQDISVIQQIVEPLAEAIEELTETIQAAKSEVSKEVPDYFDKDFNKNISASVTKIAGFLSQFKQDINIDLSPINSIATEIKKQNEAIISLLNKSNSNQSDELYRLITAMVNKNNAFIEKGFQVADYSKQLQSISDALTNKEDNRVERLTIIYNQNGDRIREVIPVYKK